MRRRQKRQGVSKDARCQQNKKKRKEEEEKNKERKTNNIGNNDIQNAKDKRDTSDSERDGGVERRSECPPGLMNASFLLITSSFSFVDVELGRWP